MPLPFVPLCKRVVGEKFDLRADRIGELDRFRDAGREAGGGLGFDSLFPEECGRRIQVSRCDLE